MQHASKLSSLFEQPVSAVEMIAGEEPDALHPEEETHVANASTKRRREYSGGRSCARLALKNLGIVDFPLRMSNQRIPMWPESVCGSITHCLDYCGAVVAPKNHYCAIGIDVEQRGRLKLELEQKICTIEELDWLASFSSRERRDMATLLFSAKESFYKCQFCISEQWVGFHDVTVRVKEDRFHIVLNTDISKFALHEYHLTGKYLLDDNHIFTGIALSQI